MDTEMLLWLIIDTKYNKHEKNIWFETLCFNFLKIKYAPSKYYWNIYLNV